MLDGLLLIVTLTAAFTSIVATVNMHCGPSEPEYRRPVARLRALVVGWRPMWSVRIERRHNYPFCRIIPLPQAAQMAREQTFDTRAAKVAKTIGDGTNVDNLHYYAVVLADADWVALYGRRRDAARLEKINRAELKDADFVDDGDALKRYWERVPIYTRIHMRRSDVERRIGQLIAAD